MLLALAFLKQSPGIDFTINLNGTRMPISKSLYGAFFEEINHAGDGGLYAELLQNRGFERGKNGEPAPEWISSHGSAILDSENPLNSARPRSLRFSGTVINKGYWGISLVKGEHYRLEIWAKGSGSLSANLGSASSSIGPLSLKWQHFQNEITARETSKSAQLAIKTERGTAWIGFASLMPDKTLSTAPLRTDLASLVAEMKPSFVRFPGGCFVEGQDFDRAWNWKKTLGPNELRPGKDWRFWGYSSTDGLGLHEYLQWCEDMGSEALFVTNCGMTHGPMAPMASMGKYVNDAVDAIEYANGAADSPFGAMRANNGHPKPFNLRYVEIGNENGGPIYDEHYALMAKAIKAKFPDIQLVACVWGGVPKSYPLEIVDEHYYADPAFFWSQIHKYDTYDRSGPKVYVGEYAVTSGCGKGNLAAALGEAAFMTGMERNSDIVKMASYAPLFINNNHGQWNPNAIVFDSSQSYGTPSYWVQRLFAQNRPDQLVNVHDNYEPSAGVMRGAVSLQTWQTSAEFKDLSVVVKGKDHRANINTSDTWTAKSGNWTFGKTLAQTDVGESKIISANALTLPLKQPFTVSVMARKLSGREGFIIMLGGADGLQLQWNVGGWGNTKHAFQVSGGSPFEGGVSGQIETGRWYNVMVKFDGSRVQGYLDGQMIQEMPIPPSYSFAHVTGIDQARHEVVCKLVNGADVKMKVKLHFVGGKVNSDGSATVLTSRALLDENDFSHPLRISPSETKIHLGSDRSYWMPAHSLNILRFKMN